MNAPLVMLEFNELTPVLMDRFIQQGHLPAFKKLRGQSIVAITDAEEAPPALEPWIQWVTVHTGLSFAEHGVFDLGEGESLRAPRLWDLVAAAGERSWVCGSMNATVASEADQSTFLIPDPWAIALLPRPAEEFGSFYKFIRTYVQEYTRDRPPLKRVDYLRFAAFMLRNGMSLRTVALAVQQLGGEKLAKTPRWRRAVVLDRILWDVFRCYYRRLKPRFSTFFLNSTAHFQHYHWRDMEPESFGFRSKSDTAKQDADAILTGYKMMDRIVQECLELCGRDATIVLCTALGQQPLTKYDNAGGKQIFKPRDVTVLLKFAGYHGNFHYSPVMAEQFHLFFDNESDAKDAEEKLRVLQISGEEVMELRRDGSQIFAGCAIIREPDENISTIVTPNSNKTATFEMLFYPVGGVKSGMHHPEGILWIRKPSLEHRVVERKISLREIAPTLASLVGIDQREAFASPPAAEFM